MTDRPRKFSRKKPGEAIGFVVVDADGGSTDLMTRDAAREARTKFDKFYPDLAPHRLGRVVLVT